MTGGYSYHQGGLGPQAWTIYPTCVQVVGNLREPLELAVACTLHVASTSGTRTAFHNADCGAVQRPR